MASPWSTGNRSSCSSHRTEAPHREAVHRRPSRAPAPRRRRSCDRRRRVVVGAPRARAGSRRRAHAPRGRHRADRRRDPPLRCRPARARLRPLQRGGGRASGQRRAPRGRGPLLRDVGLAHAGAGTPGGGGPALRAGSRGRARRPGAAQGRRRRAGARPAPVSVVLYERGQVSDVTGSHAWVNGLFGGRVRLPVGPALPARGELARLLTHEYAHAVIHHRARGRAPRWLQEGLAQVLEGRAADPALAASGGLTLSGLEALVTDPDPRRAHAGYELALFVVADLLDRGGMESMRALLARPRPGERIPGAPPPRSGWRLAEPGAQWGRRPRGG